MIESIIQINFPSQFVFGQSKRNQTRILGLNKIKTRSLSSGRFHRKIPRYFVWLEAGQVCSASTQKSYFTRTILSMSFEVERSSLQQVTINLRGNPSKLVHFYHYPLPLPRLTMIPKLGILDPHHCLLILPNVLLP